MNYIDITIAIPLAWLAFKGFKKGLAVEVFSLVALIAGIYAAVYFSGYAGKYLNEYFSLEKNYLPIASFVVTFIVVVVAVYFIGKTVEKLLNVIALGLLNKLAGMAFGILKGAVLVSIIILIMNSFDKNIIAKEKQDQSLLYEPVASIAPFLWQKTKEFDINAVVKKVKQKGEEIIE